jgi:hypothetical protein
MNAQDRISSILKTHCLNSKVTGFSTFNLSQIILPESLNVEIPQNVRLGHQVEKMVGQLIRASSNYEMLLENIQIIDDKVTLGEIDFVIEEVKSKRQIHLEMAYKFYLYDPAISDEKILNWIGPNRNDSLNQKLEKLRKKQFPLLFHPKAAEMFERVDLENMDQALCLMVNLYIPYEFSEEFTPEFQPGIKGYYINVKTFVSLDDPSKQYHLPTKNRWGLDPKANQEWSPFAEVKDTMRFHLEHEQSVLVWQKKDEVYSSFFVVWW